ncbi:uncharacterized protein DEA37_0009656, partial [Paragonimus westermani]
MSDRNLASECNPYPGKIFNDYYHRDVYAGVRIDYRGRDVNPGIFMRVMKGDAQLKAAGKKVLQSGPQDNVFVYFSDHGAEGLICFPEGNHDTHKLTLDQQFEEVRETTVMSHVMKYGDM